jgi:hypothetical protein
MATGTRRARIHWALGASVALALVLPSLGYEAAPPPRPYEPTEIEVKAAFLYHFAQLVVWPEAPNAASESSPVVLAVVGRDPFGDRLEATIGQETVRGHPIRIDRAARASDLTASPQILFVGASDLVEADRTLAAMHDAPVLTVSALKGFAQHGGMVEFRVTPDARVAFDINLRAVERAGLKMSSQLLKIARVVDVPR